MAGNQYDNGQGADPRRWTAPPGGNPQQQYGQADGPEYFTAPHDRGPAAGPGGADPYGADQPGHTRAFPVGDGGYPFDPDDPGRPPQEYRQQYSQEYPPDGYGPQGYDGQGYGPGYGQDYGQDNVAVYRAGGQSAPRVAGPRPRWRELLTGIYRSPNATFDRTRDHQVWLPAVCVSLLYGVLAILGLGLTRDDVLDSTFTVALTALAASAVVFTLAGGVLGAVTYALARQFGGDGPWRSTIGLAVLIGWTSDAPRLLLALFLPADNLVVQVVGWATWLLCAALLTTMVRRVHDLPWGKAAGAASLQLLALLVLIKLPTLG
ncbi:YIP1 family protein [Kitasatospora sp. NPDC057015]|uniref:Yip1 family protein n=1 Tax=Kitasatospora sp. NPDC057015 TaxID=3346001 RepID=UPI003644130E